MEQTIVLLSICSGEVGIRIVWISKDLQIRAVSCKQLVSFVKLLCKNAYKAACPIFRTLSSTFFEIMKKKYPYATFFGSIGVSG